MYTGREYDSESGYYYYRARYYDPGTGRFLQKDPHPGKLSMPGTVVNGYIYTLNNPVNRIDPSGRFSFFEKMLIGLGAAVAAVVIVATLPVSAGILGGMLIGAGVGAATGFALGAGINLAVGRRWNDNIGEAVAIGAIAGVLAGGITMAARGAAFFPQLGNGGACAGGGMLAMGRAIRWGIKKVITRQLEPELQPDAEEMRDLRENQELQQQQMDQELFGAEPNSCAA
jgi:RHS repeat-associated protein